MYHIVDLSRSSVSFHSNMRILILFSEFGSLLVVSLIDTLQHSALDQSGFYPGFGRYDSYEVVDTHIQTCSLFIVKFDKFFLFCVSHLHHKAISLGDYSQISTNCFFRACIEGLVLTTSDRQRMKTVSVQGVGLSATPSRNFLLAATPKLCYADLL